MDEFKFLTTSFLVNPGAGATSYNNTLFTAQLNSGRAYIDKLFIDSYLLADSTGTPLTLSRLNFQIQFIDTDSILNNAQVFTPTIATAINQRIINACFNNQPNVRYVDIKMIVNSPRKIRLFVAATFPALSSASDSLQASLTLRWVNLPLTGRLPKIGNR